MPLFQCFDFYFLMAYGAVREGGKKIDGFDGVELEPAPKEFQVFFGCVGGRGRCGRGVQ